MVDAVLLLRDNHAKLSSRVARLRSQLLAAETELREVDTAVRVMARLGLAPDVVADEKESSGSTADIVLATLAFSEAEGKAPKDVFTALLERGVTYVQADAVRTSLWRMANTNKIRVKDGRYWRIGPPTTGTKEGAEIDPAPSGAYRPEGPSDSSDIPMFSTANPVAG